MDNDDKMLRKKSKWTTILGVLFGTAFFALFWKQGFGLNVFLFTTITFLIVQFIKFVVKSKWYFSKWDVLLILYWVMSIGVVINDSLSMNFIASSFVVLTSPVIFYLAIYPETIGRFSYLNSLAIYFQQIFSPFAGIIDYFRGLFRIRTQKFISPNSMKIVIGVLISVPILCLLTFLLMTADEAFKEFVTKFLDAINYFIKEILNFDSIWDIFVWFVVVVGSIFGLIGYVFAKVKFPLADNKYEESEYGIDMVVSSVVLTGINILFVVFLLVQSSYLFFGMGDISELGLTYSEYARKGYWELQLVTLIVGAILYIIIRWGKKHGILTSRIAKTNLILLLINTLIILFSAIFRMWLYVDAYGLTLLRIYPMVFMVFEFLLLAFLIPSVVSRRVFAQFSFFSFGLFSLLLTILTLASPERLVFEFNYNRALNGQRFDADYHLTLSSDAWYKLIGYKELTFGKTGIGEFMPCVIVNKYQSMKDRYTWHEWNWGRSRAITAIETQLLMQEDSEEFMNRCDENLLTRLEEIKSDYTKYISDKDYRKIYDELWVKTDVSYLKYLDGSQADPEVISFSSTEKEYIENYPRNVFEHSPYGSTLNESVNMKVIYPDDGYLDIGQECVSDYLTFKLQDGHLRISSSSVLPLGADVELGNYRGLDETYYQNTLKSFATGEIYRYDCFTNFKY